MTLVATMHQPQNKDVKHLSYDRHVTLCGEDCGNFIYVTKHRNSDLVLDETICTKCSEQFERHQQ